VNKLLDARAAVLHDDRRIRPGHLSKILQYYKPFDTTDPRDRIHGAFGIVGQSVHQHLRVDYKVNCGCILYLDAMTYMPSKELGHASVLEIFLVYPLSVFLSSPLPRPLSWVPDFSRNDPIIPHTTDHT
jgi:hypothetical protein